MLRILRHLAYDGPRHQPTHNHTTDPCTPDTVPTTTGYTASGLTRRTRVPHAPICHADGRCWCSPSRRHGLDIEPRS